MASSKVRFCSALLALSAFAAPALAADAVLAVGVSPPTVTLGGSGLDAAVAAFDVADLFAHQFTLSFNPDVLQLTSVSAGTFLGTGGSTFFDGGVIDNTLGTVSFVFDTLIGAVPGVSGSGVLARFHFDAVGVGASTLVLSDALLLNSAGDTLPTQISNSSVTVIAAVVPEPSSYLLLGAGIAGLAAWRRRQVAVAA